MRKLQELRDDLLAKLDVSERKLRQRSVSQLQATRRTTTTTEASPHRGLFDSDSMKKMNDLVKDIESVGRFFTDVLKEAF